MILITKIECIQTDKDEYELHHYGVGLEQVPPLFNNQNEPVEYAVVREVVRGRRFCRADGTDIMVGLSQQAADVLGLQYEAWKELEGRADYYQQSVANLDREIIAIKSAGFLTRLKWLFTGYNNH